MEHDELAISAGKSPARYVYGVVGQAVTLSLGNIGIENNDVYTLPAGAVSAIVHNCPAEPYASENEDTVKTWVLVHQKVLDEASRRFDTVIPLRFDTIVSADQQSEYADEVIRQWLKQNVDKLQAVLEKIRGKDEYVIKVFYDPELLAETVLSKSQALQELKEKSASKSAGLAYMYRQKIESMLREKVNAQLDAWFEDFHKRIQECVDELIVEKTQKKDQCGAMVLHFSCLVPMNSVKGLGDVLEEMDRMQEITVHFSGPWPPYSFVGQLGIQGGGEWKGPNRKAAASG